MLEYKSVKTRSETEIQVIELYENFGWKVNDTREAGSGLTLRFARETSMPHYEELVVLEREYFSSPERKTAKKTFASGKTIAVLTVFGVVGLILCISCFTINLSVALTGLALFIVAAALWIPFIVSRKKAAETDNYNKNLSEEKSRRNAEILAECRALLG